MNRLLEWMAAAAILASLAACSTPAPVRDLASQGASVADQADRETRAFLKRAADAYARRADSAELRARRNAEDAADTNFTDFIEQKVGGPDPSGRVELIRSIASESRQTREALEAKIAQNKEALAAQPVASESTSKALADTKKAFIVLSQELSAREWMEFGWKYFSQVKDAYKAAPATPSQ